MTDLDAEDLLRRLGIAIKQINALERERNVLQAGLDKTPQVVRPIIDQFQDIFSWQQGESRNALVCDIRDRVEAALFTHIDTLRRRLKTGEQA